ncbi:MAG: threonine--tRNA ligase [Candidatus Magasanikbacteria bacterium]|nr:threonine--tRNA ligase [Candidatus Magasanikbacteria bacterium]
MDNEHLEHLRHSCAHLLAAAVLEIWPHAKRTIGPAIENGFYYDFDLGETKISESDFEMIEKKMHELVKGWTGFERHEVNADEARKKFTDNPYKCELIDEFSKDGQTLTLYQSGNYIDLCRGGHAGNPSEELQHFKLMSLAGAYWRGSEKNKMLTRVYGTCFPSAEELDNYLKMTEEAKKRDHRKLGKELHLFALTEEVGPGLPLFYPAGAILRRTVENFIVELQEKRGYVPIWIPHVTKSQLYEISGHLAKYDAMYPPMKLPDEADYYIKPMNCPHFMMLYRTEPHSYRELPMRWTCTTTNYRYEKSGELSGLTRVRALTQDDCHVFARPDQIEGEINLMLDMVSEVYKTFGFENFWVRISTHDPANKEKYIGDPAVWSNTEAALQSLIEKRGWEHEIGVGEAAFYGPKLDFIFKDVIGRSWQLSTIQLDMNLPERFELEYAGSDGTKQRPVVIHRAILGSTERFLGILIEHFGGAFPVWLSPTQVMLAPVSSKHVEGAQALAHEFREAGIRVSVDEADETVGKKVRNAAQQKVPYIIVVGDKELAGEDMMVRVRGKEEQEKISKASFVERVSAEIKNRAR